MITWWSLSLFISLGSCVFLNLNKKHKLEGLRARAWSTMIAYIILSPALFLVPFPKDPAFYLCAFLGGTLMSFVGEIYFNLSAKYGGPVVSLARPLSIIFAFFVWAFIEPFETLEMLSRPIVLIGVLASFTLAIWGQVRMVKDNVNVKQALKFLTAAAFLGGLTAPVVKYGMSFTWELSHIFLWSFFFHLAGSTMCFCRHAFKRNSQPLYTREFMKFGLTLGPYHASFGPMFAFALFLAPNPAFVGLISMLSTVWLMLYYAARKDEAHIRPRSVTMLLSAAVILIVSTKSL